ncbi:haloacid dehalogenase superfamily, subfamily IA, variant 1 with third motif having Dx(3-4)D or Dx(3-4)E [Halovenus aranensis]|jgi:HAD superfamily hydrolase (TIGR01549 family)|uniref:Haloacid dehalogenase superfamily, subfamily IA, variant 1 with third motif having Dx(3-4)D or Dx(3-4)E n=1 Tax=Halovenus aranensis TaxID=890420 RepID=A0A1G8YFT0_9EURY|nr:HAD-IA family hydrolase [Halovenus aranensis]SDK01581.1 haloacid dehalogenase superfamily, subfamily IA, variant 1 with third motif having Dx(3-4)D or Dx(3-4)E [Halovenus aranensis]
MTTPTEGQTTPHGTANHASGVGDPDPILFDMDGVILQGRRTDPEIYVAAADRAIAEFDVHPTPDQQAVLRSHRCDEVVASVCTALGIEYEAFWRHKERHASEIANERLRAGERALYDGASALDALAESRPLALVSNNRHQTVSFVAEYFGLDETFAVVRGRDPTPEGFHRRKPDPFYLEDALDALGVTTGVYVGDREKDLRAASRAGLEGVLVRREFNRDETPTTAPAAEISSLSDLLDLPLLGGR